MKDIYIFFSCVLLLCCSVEANNCEYPLYYQYYSQFPVQLNDVKTLTQNQYRRNNIPDFTSSNGLKLQRISYNTIYNGTLKQISKSKSKANIMNDSLDIYIQLETDVNGTLKKTHYNVIVRIQSLMVNYTKEIIQTSFSPIISNITTQLPVEIFKITYTPTPSVADAKKLVDAVTSTGLSIFTQITNVFTNISTYMQTNVKSQRISTQFDKDSFILDMNTKLININQDYLKNGILGDILAESLQQCPKKQIQRLQNYHTFISKQLMNNMFTYAFHNFKQFINFIPINRNTIRTQIFNFQLQDLRTVMPQAIKRYSKYLKNQLIFYCKSQQIGQLLLTQQQQSQNVQWKCQGYLLNTDSGNVQILDFHVVMKHILYFGLNDQFLSVYSNILIAEEVIYYPIDKLYVQNLQRASQLMKDTFNDLRTYTVGTYFSIKKGTNIKKFVSNGLWLGSSNHQKSIQSE